MLQIGNVLVSLDIVEGYFCCDIESCKGECCIEGDAGAPLLESELEEIRKVLPAITPDLTPAGRHEIEENGPSYIDEEGDLVTTIVEGRECAFCTYAPGGVCLCSFEKAFREGRTDFYKPISCHLYPARIKEFPSFTAVNYHRWKICRRAEILGKAKGIRVYQFLREPLTRRFGEEWYEELRTAAEEYLRQYGR